MKRTRQHNIEGAILNIPLRYDPQAGMDIEWILRNIPT